MDTACLRIKFTPLLQEAPKSSEKCCLEIVPEVSCIQNLDKLTWREESNFIEYIIPMTYKIILRKRNTSDTSNGIAKTFHSCVDLLLSSSQSHIGLASGDVSRILSDTFIISKLLAPMPIKDVNNLTTLDQELSKITQSGTATDDTSLELTDITEKETEEINNNDLTKSDPQQFKIDCLGKLYDKLTNIDNVSSMFINGIDPKKITNTSEQPVAISKLSLSPYCSINTQDTENISFTNTASKAVTCNIYNSLKELHCTSNQSKFSYENDILNNISHRSSLSKQEPTIKLQFPYRVKTSPEIRIAQYVHYMKKELLPLNEMLHELITKCTVLGVYEVPSNILKSVSKSATNNLTLFKSVCMYNYHVRTETREKSISNRAVYSVIFDE